MHLQRLCRIAKHPQVPEIRVCILCKGPIFQSMEGTSEVLKLIYPTTELSVKTDPSKEFVTGLMKPHP